MRCIIDGYNLIYALGLLPSGIRRKVYPPGKLEQAREALEQLLLKGLRAEQLRETCVVYDALEPPQWLPNAYTVKGMQVVFARDYTSADEWILETLQKISPNAPVTVVSSDHRIQACAKRRKWPFYDSDQWYYGGMPIEGIFPKKASVTAHDSSSQPNVAPEEVAYWLEVFGETEVKPSDKSLPKSQKRGILKNILSDIE